MNTDSSHKALLGAILIVGIIILVVLLSPRGGASYAYRGTNLYTASTYPLQSTGTTISVPATGTYSFIRYVPKTTTRTTTTGSTYTYYTYPQTQSVYQDTGTMFPDGCTLTSPFSLTTGQPCS